MLDLMDSLAAPVATGFGIGIALGGAPGPVQAVLLSESTRGLSRGFRALAGANLTFGLLLVGAAAGFSHVALSSLWMRLLHVGGGLMLLWLAVDGIRSSLDRADTVASSGIGVPPFARGATVVLLNPGAWLFLVTVAGSVFATARIDGGVTMAVASALAMLAGVALCDAGVVVLGGVGLRRAHIGLRVWIQRGLAVLLGALGCWLLLMTVTV